MKDLHSMSAYGPQMEWMSQRAKTGFTRCCTSSLLMINNSMQGFSARCILWKTRTMSLGAVA